MSNQLIIGVGLGLTLGYLLAKCEQAKKTDPKIRGYFPPVLPDARPLHPFPLRWAGKAEPDTTRFSHQVI